MLLFCLALTVKSKKSKVESSFFSRHRSMLKEGIDFSPQLEEYWRKLNMGEQVFVRFLSVG